MTSKRYLGNIITDTPTAPSSPYQDGAASGVWSLAEAYTYTKAELWPIAGNFLDIAVIGIKQNRDLEQVSFSTLGNSTFFGDLSNDDVRKGACGNGVYGFFGGGAGFSNLIDRITFAEGGTATDFGDLTMGGVDISGGSNNTRGIFFGGDRASATNRIDYITMASAGNATLFGDVTNSSSQPGGNAGTTSTRLVSIENGTNGSIPLNNIGYLTIASTGNSSDFGDTTVARDLMAGVNDATRYVIGGGDTSSDVRTNVMDYVTMATTGNATDFGDLTVGRMSFGGASNSTRGIFAGGLIYPGNSNVIDYITIASTGNALDFGDMSVVQDGVMCASSSNPSQIAAA